jgi:[acyl-carrier-protein] S-malonyltransferase
MKPAAERLSPGLAALTLCDPSIPVYTNVDATPVRTAEGSRDTLVRQVASPVRWSDEVNRMVDDGIDTFIEFGPGRVLAGLMRRIRKGVRVVSVPDVSGLSAALHELEAA